MKAKRTLLAVDALLVAILACNIPRNQNVAPPSGARPTETLRADVVLEASDTPTTAFTETPSLTPTITLTPTPSVPEVRVSAATNCRSGPGTVYDLLYTLQPGQVAQVIGKSTPMNYWIINFPGGTSCWLWGQYATVSGNIAALAEYPIPATPTPSMPANPSGFKVHFTCTRTGLPVIYNEVHVEMEWVDNATNEDGYYVYRNDELLATLGPDSTSYSDDTTQPAFMIVGSTPPQTGYSVQAFNAAGNSKKVNKSISCFD